MQSEDFIVDNVDDIQLRVTSAEKSANYQEHEAFWDDMMNTKMSEGGTATARTLEGVESLIGLLVQTS